MFTKVSVLVPTRKRVDRLCTLIESFIMTTMGDSTAAELVFRVDDDDQETQEFLQDWNYCSVVGPRYAGYGSMPRFFNELAEAANGDVLMCGNDDMVFKSKGWPAQLLEASNRYPDGIFDFGVSTMNDTHYPFSIVSKKAVEHLGFLWDPRIFWGDIFLRDIMAAFGRLEMIPSVVIEHDWAGLRPDHVFKETRASKSKVERDAHYWSNVHAPAVSEAVQKLKQLVSVGAAK
jgi:hypothetical protein